MFSLAGLRKIKEEGVYFHSHIDGAQDFHGTGREYADPVKSRLPRSPWLLMSVRPVWQNEIMWQNSVDAHDTMAEALQKRNGTPE